MKDCIKISCLALMVLLLASCSPDPVTGYEFMMDTQCSITVYERGDEAFIDGTFQFVRQLASRLDRYDESSEIFRINAMAGREPVKVTGQVFKLISRARDLCEATDGLFNILMGNISDLWGFTSAEPHVPSDEELAELTAAADISNLVLNEEDQTVYIADEKASLDLGAIAKGYASQAAADYLRSHGVEKAVINFGGNVYCIGTRPDSSPWRVGIQNPDTEYGGYFTTVEVSDCAVVTSGGYQRYFIQDGVRYHHILDPATGRPADSALASVSIICEDGALADALSTACFVAGADKAEELCRKFGVSALLLTQSGEVIRI